MKKLNRSSTKLGWLGAVTLGLLCAGTSANAQTFTTLKSFGVLTNVTGYHPNSLLVQGPDGTLYGTTSEGELNVHGTVFKVQPDGTGFTVLKWFTNVLEGDWPVAGLTLSDSALYGTTQSGGSSNYGVVFKVNTNGRGFAVLKEFTGDDGAIPSGLTISDGTLYGTTQFGGSSNNGTLFKLNTDGTDHTVLKHFTDSDGYPAGLTPSGSLLYGSTAGGSSGVGTVFKVNTDGTGFTVLKHFSQSDGVALSGHTLSGSVLYGATYGGGNWDNGTVFRLNTDGTGFIVLKHFSALDFGTSTNSEGAKPLGGLTLSGSVLFGTTMEGGSSGQGTVFQINTDGTGFQVLKHFIYPEGMWPYAGVTLSGSTLYGTTAYGGIINAGTIFKMNTDGTGYAVIKEFKGDSDGKQPAGLTRSGSDLYGVTVEGGTNGTGTVFKLNIAGTGYTALKEFGKQAWDDNISATTNSDGGGLSGVIERGGVLYGNARYGGSAGSGTLFRMNTDGTGFAVLKHFSSHAGGVNGDGAYPLAGVTLSDDTIYGTTSRCGFFSSGTVFKLNTNGTSFTVINHFTAVGGREPAGELTLSGNVIYSTTSLGGTASMGTVFKLNTDGTGFTLLKAFSASSYDPVSGWYTNSDGAYPAAGLTLSGSVLYGTTPYGGSSGDGTIFKLNTDGTGFAVLKHFAGSNGSRPFGGLRLSGGALYGTTWSGGITGEGTIFRIETNGSNFRVLKSLNNTMGLRPRSTMLLLDGALYGTASEGGVWNKGTVFKLDLSIPLTVQRESNAAVLSWSDPWFSLQSAPSSTGTYTNVPGATSPYTNAITGPQQFFRLIGN